MLPQQWWQCFVLRCDCMHESTMVKSHFVSLTFKYAPAISGARVSACMVLNPKHGIFHLSIRRVNIQCMVYCFQVTCMSMVTWCEPCAAVLVRNLVISYRKGSPSTTPTWAASPNMTSARSWGWWRTSAWTGARLMRSWRSLAPSMDAVCLGQWWKYSISLNTLRPRQNGRHFADSILKYNFLNENRWILKKISLIYVPDGLISNMAALVQIMAWCQTGDKPLSEPMLVCCTDAYMRH